MNLGDFTEGWKAETVTRNEGITPDEQYLNRLCDRSFLSLWSYVGLYRNQKADGKGDGKELCDLLVVCGDDILIFSDKGCQFQNTGNIQLDWSRWFRSAIDRSAKQAWGAGRWIKSYPEQIFLDRACTRKFPIDLPASDRMRIHYIVVAHNASERCAAYFPGSSRTLLFDSSVVGIAHYSPQNAVRPFVVGWMDTARPFIHILDDDSLDILLNTRDTITDFVEYLRWKEALLQSAWDRNLTFLYAGEEELLANYLLSINNGERGFALPDEPLDAIHLCEGDWRDFLNSAQRAAQIKADENSYFWDYIIERFCKNILAGTSYDRVTSRISDREKSVRLLAREPRIRRRILASGLIALLRKTPADFRAVRVAIPDRKTAPYYCFLLLPRYDSIPTDTYRQVRGRQLEALMRVTKLVYPEALDIVGFATESGAHSPYRSEDVMYLDTRGWTDEEQEDARQLQKDTNFLTNVKMQYAKDYDFPVDLPRTRSLEKNPRNKPCPCGSGKKYKKCHGA